MINTLFHFNLPHEIANKILFKVFLDENKIKYKEVTDYDIEISTDDTDEYTIACNKYFKLKMEGA